MNNLVKYLLVLVVIAIIPLAIIFGIYLDILPQSLQYIITMLAVFAAIGVIVGGNLFLMYDDIKTGRYKNRT